jgi:meso-butanediol dehydrogenase/(S,S)-butanediol dehydrogenase/diacetyl reductase
MSGISGKAAVVTGAGAGIGRAIALGLAKQGAKVLVADINAEAAAATSRDIASAGGVSVSFRVDVSKSSEVAEMIARTVSAFGSVDIMVNNAGVISNIKIVDLPEEEWDRVHSVNLRGTFLCTKAAARQMIVQGRGGKIVNVASEAGKAAYASLAHYSASKAGVILFTRGVALELAQYNINVNSVCPGNVDTAFFRKSIGDEAKLFGVTEEQRLNSAMSAIPLKRLEAPEEVANAVVFLCSDEASYITGEDLNVTGGSTMV